MAKKSVSDQMELFEDGGFRDQGNTKDPVSNNPVPVGSTQQEVRDDIPANLSEGEFVLPADVVRYHGLEKIMGIRDQAKDGLQKMEQMGQMGNSDQATIPDGVPFKQMALGGTVVNPAIQQPKILPQLPNQSGGGVTTTTPPIVKKPSTYVPPVQPPSDRRSIRDGRLPNYQGPQYRNVPTVGVGTKPTYDDLLGTQFGQLQDSVTKKYVNAETGEVLYIPFVNGKPVYPIPIGFSLETEVKAEEAKEDPTKAIRSTSVRQEDNNDSPDNTNEQEQDYKVAMQLARYDENEKSPKDKSMLGSIVDFAEKAFKTGIAGQLVDAMKPDYKRPEGGGLFGMDVTENKALDGGANSRSYLDSLARESGYTSLDAMTKQYGVEPSFKFGTKRGDVSLVTGKPYDFAGQSRKKDGTIAFASWNDWTDDLSDGYDTGWSGGFTSEADIQAAITANDKRADRGIAGYTHSRDGGWNRTAVDDYNAKVAERNGGYIDEKGNFAKGKPTDSRTSSVTASVKNKAVIQTPKSNIMTGGLDDGGSRPQVPIGTERVDTTIGTGFQQTSPTTSMDSGDGTAVPTGVGSTGDLNQIYSGGYEDNSNDGDGGDSGMDDSSSDFGGGGGGWTAKGGFINKRTMTMSKVSPNKKKMKRGGLASRK